MKHNVKLVVLLIGISVSSNYAFPADNLEVFNETNLNYTVSNASRIRPSSLVSGAYNGFIINEGQTKLKNKVISRITEYGDIYYKDKLVGKWTEGTALIFNESTYKIINFGNLTLAEIYTLSEEL